MSCPNSTNQRNFTAEAGSLPEGYCPTTWQEFFDDMAARLLITSPLNQSSFATGSTMPSSNVGPWLKNCNQWFFFDDSTGLYLPQEKGGFDNLQYFSSSDSYIVPEDIYKIKVHVWGGGGGGFSDGGSGAYTGGGGGGYGVAILTVTPGQVIPIVVGAGGSQGGSPTAGGATTVLTLTANGGNAGSGTGLPVTGGTVTGATYGVTGGTSGYAVIGQPSQGGFSPYGGSGGAFNTTTDSVKNGVAPGGGGSGGYSSEIGGNGAAGGCLIEW